MKLLLADCKRLVGIQPIDLDRLDQTERRAYSRAPGRRRANQLDPDFRQALIRAHGKATHCSQWRCSRVRDAGGYHLAG